MIKHLKSIIPSHTVKLSLFSALALTLSFNLAHAGRRARLKEDQPSPATIYFKEKHVDHSIEYDVLQPSRGLHREALKAFHFGEYAHARTCFSLALKSSPRSEDLILNYSLFSLVVPWMEGRSLSRAKGLLDLIQTPRGMNDPRYIIAKETIALNSDDLEINLGALREIKHPYYKKIATDMVSILENGGDVMHSDWSKKLLPIRFAPREKRERR
jgi:hypothetical protein